MDGSKRDHPNTPADTANDIAQPDWRRESARRLDGFTLHHRPYQRWSEAWDHNHCEACWATFSLEVPNGLRQGYAPGADDPFGACYSWVCETCVSELAADCGWHTSEALSG